LARAQATEAKPSGAAGNGVAGKEAAALDEPTQVSAAVLKNQHMVRGHASALRSYLSFHLGTRGRSTRTHPRETHATQFKRTDYTFFETRREEEEEHSKNLYRCL
jgi:hypothetical protein